jgi:hypothetical protein
MAKRSAWSIPYVQWREGKPRFIPSPELRAVGFKGKDLRHGETGPWYTRDEAAEWGKLNVEKIRAAQQGKAAPLAPARGDTLADLIKAYLASPDFAALADRTRQDQARLEQLICFKPVAGKPDKSGKPRLERSTISQTPARFIDRADVKALAERLEKRHGLAQGNKTIKFMSAAFRFGTLAPRWRLSHNPCHRLNLRTPAPRVAVWTEAMVRQMVAAADIMGRPEVGDCIYLGLFTGQRLGDRLQLIDGGLVGGGRMFRQSKTGAVVIIPETRELTARLAAMRDRRAKSDPARKVVYPNMITSSISGLPLTPSGYNQVFNDVKRRAIAGIIDQAETAAAASRGVNEPVWLLPPGQAGLDAMRDQDLRDTAVTWLALADCTLMQIASITGHSIASIQTTIRHYLYMDVRLAGAAIDKLQKWVEKEGMKL